MGTQAETWNESESKSFLELGAAFVPWRLSIAEAVVRLLPAESEEVFTCVDVGIGGGWLSEAVLGAFSSARVVGFDGSPLMIEESRKRLADYGDRLDLRAFKLQDPSWTDHLQAPVRAFVSCLVLHHLDGEAKRRLYRRLFDHLEPSGALLVADLIQPGGECSRAYCEVTYDEDVRFHSMQSTGSLENYEKFLERKWNYFAHPDESDQPSPIADHLRWLAEAGFSAVDVFWSRAGHALYGGYKPT